MVKSFHLLLLLGSSVLSAIASETSSENAFFEQYQNRYTLFHKISFRHLNTEFTKQTNMLTEKKQTGEIPDSIYQQETKELLLNLSYLRKRITDEADYFARIHKQQLPSEEKEAFILLEYGKPKEALQLYKQLPAIISLKQKDTKSLPSVPDSLIPTLERYIHLCSFTAGTKNNTEALYYSHAIATSDTLCGTRMLPYAHLLYENNQKEEAFVWSKRIYRNSQKVEERAHAAILSGIIASDLKIREDIGRYFNQALEQYDDLTLTPDTSALYRSYQEMLHSLASHYYIRKEYKPAIDYLQKLIDTNATLITDKKQALHKPLLRSYLYLAYCYLAQQKYERTNRVLEQAIQTATQNKNRLQEETDYYLAHFYRLQMYTNMWLRSEKVAAQKMDKAIEIASHLMQTTDSYHGHLADILTSKCQLNKTNTKLCISLYEQIIRLMLSEGIHTSSSLIRLNKYRKELADRYFLSKRKEEALAIMDEINTSYQLFFIGFPEEIGANYSSSIQEYHTRLLETGNIEKANTINRQALNQFLLTTAMEQNDIYLVNSALLLSKSLAKSNHISEAREILKKHEPYIDRIDSKKEAQKWSDAYERAYRDLE